MDMIDPVTETDGLKIHRVARGRLHPLDHLIEFDLTEHLLRFSNIAWLQPAKNEPAAAEMLLRSAVEQSMSVGALFQRRLPPRTYRAC